MSRFRSRPVNVTSQIVGSHLNSGVTYTVDQTSIWNRTESMTDEVTIGYFSKEKKNDLLPLNPMSRTTWSYHGSSGSSYWSKDYPAGTTLIDTELSGDLALVGWWSAQSFYDDPATGLWTGAPAWPSDGSVTVPALANARAAGMDVGTAVAELGKTVSMIAHFRENVFRRAGRILEGITRRKTYRDLTSLHTAFSETWLEGRYGWRTLAYEIQDLHIALIKLQDFGLRRVRGYATEEATASITARNAEYGLLKVKKGVSWSNIARGHVLVQQDITRTKRSGSIIDAIIEGLAFVDPLTTLYEVIPYSFIVDWFVNINDNVTAFSPFATGRHLGTWVSAKEEVKTVITMTPKLTTGAPYVHDLKGRAQYVSVASRTTYERYPATPSLSLTFDVNLNPEKLVDLASIFFLKHFKLMSDLSKSVRV